MSTARSVLGALLAIALAAPAGVDADSGTLTAHELVLLCGSPKPEERTACTLYVAGVLDTALYVGERQRHPMLCPPDGVDGDTLHEIVLGFLYNATEAELENTAASMVFAALAQRFACRGL